MINMQTNHATSCMDFIRSMAQRYTEMVNTPEILTNSDRRARIEDETRDMHRMHLEGHTIGAISRCYGMSHSAILQRFRTRGLSVRLTQKRRAKA